MARRTHTRFWVRILKFWGANPNTFPNELLNLIEEDGRSRHPAVGYQLPSAAANLAFGRIAYMLS